MLNAGELGELGPEQREPVEIITRRARMLGSLVEDITLILLTETRPPETCPVALDELARMAVADFGVATAEAGVQLQAEIAPNLPKVSGAPVHLRRVLDNLIGNAIKFTPSGGKITVRVNQEGKEIALEVQDTGIGIPEDQLTHIFERFYQVDGSSRRRYGGTGLGLALVKEIVESLNGTVQVKSKVGVGTVFVVRLPISPT